MWLFVVTKRRENIFDERNGVSKSGLNSKGFRDENNFEKREFLVKSLNDLWKLSKIVARVAWSHVKLQNVLILLQKNDPSFPNCWRRMEECVVCSSYILYRQSINSDKNMKKPLEEKKTAPKNPSHFAFIGYREKKKCFVAQNPFHHEEIFSNFPSSHWKEFPVFSLSCRWKSLSATLNDDRLLLISRAVISRVCDFDLWHKKNRFAERCSCALFWIYQQPRVSPSL